MKFEANDDNLVVEEEDIKQIAAILNEYGYDNLIRYFKSQWLITDDLIETILGIVAKEDGCTLDDIKGMKSDKGEVSVDEIESYARDWLRKNYVPTL